MSDPPAPSTTQPKTRTLTATCHCTHSRLSFTIPISTLPLPTHFCHCARCRHTHGTLASIHASIPKPSILNEASFTKYKTSENVTIWFCSTCGAQMLDHVKTVGEGEEAEKFFVAASLVDAEESVWDFERHIFVSGTGDGGLAPLLRKINGKELKIQTGDEESLEDRTLTDPETTAQQREIGARETHTKARCHCGGVSFIIHPPTSPSIFNDFEKTVTPKDKTRWYALHDTCTSCRLTSGCALVSWMFPLRSHIELQTETDDTNSNPLPYPQDGVFGTAKAYKSSDTVTRTFCGVCGATVSYSCADREDMADIAVGLLEGVDVRMEEWLEWRTERVAFGEDCMWSGVRRAVEDGLRARG